MDLQQGLLKSEAPSPLPDMQQHELPQYPAVVQGAKNNMIKYKDCVLLTRVGKFYELYLDQAEEYAPLLDIKLASKKIKDGRVAMAGFPYTQLDKYLKILVQELNKNVAISEEYPFTAGKKASSGGLMFDRAVKRVVTPGTLIDESFLDPFQNNFLLSLHFEDIRPGMEKAGSTEETLADQQEAAVGMAWLDISTGEFFIDSTTVGALSSNLARINPRETLVNPEHQSRVSELFGPLLSHSVTVLESDQCSQDLARWSHMFDTELNEESLALSSTENSAVGLLLEYAHSKIDTDDLKFQFPTRPNLQTVMSIDRNSLRGLEVLETSRDGLHQGSLLHATRRTATKGGARLLRARLASPSASIPEIERRLDLVSIFLANPALRQELVVLLRMTFDTVRLIQKIALNRGEPDDLLSLSRAIQASQNIYDCLQTTFKIASSEPSAGLMALESLMARIDLDGPDNLCRKIMEAIDEEGLSRIERQEEEAEMEAIEMSKRIIASEGTAEDMEIVPARARRGKEQTKEQQMPYEDTWIMRRSASVALRRLHSQLDNLKEERDSLTTNLRLQLKAPSLTLKWSPALGYFAHVKGGDKAALDHLNGRMVSSSKSTKSVVLDDWSRLGGNMDQRRAHIRDEEQRVFHRLKDEVRANLVKLRRNASVMDEIDVSCSFATLAEENHFTRPTLSKSNVYRIYGGRHATVELGLANHGRPFVRNDCNLSTQERIWLVTGPNMAGKSTFLRQNALIAILAQSGSYVPADYAEIGVVDKVFSRVGAADDLFRDQSTFMVEMLETAEILKHATPQSFVIMDEVGRGTSPMDGTAIAYACLHHLHYINGCRTLFATHFHTLADMAEDFQNIGFYCTRVDTEDGSFSFVHRIEKGVNRDSHALGVARLAGLPPTALETAAAALDELQKFKADIIPQDMQPLNTQAATA